MSNPSVPNTNYSHFTALFFKRFLKLERAEEILRSTEIHPDFLVFVDQFKMDHDEDKDQTVGTFGEIDLSIKQKRIRIGNNPTVDLCRFEWMGSRFKFKSLVRVNKTMGKIHKAITDLVQKESFSLKFVDVSLNGKVQVSGDKFTSKEDMVLVHVMGSSTAVMASIILFLKSNPIMTDFFDIPESRLFRVFTKSSNTCYLLINFGLFYLFKADSLLRMPTHSLKADILFENFVRQLSPELFDESVLWVKERLDFLKLSMVVKTMFHSIFGLRYNQASIFKPLDQMTKKYQHNPSNTSANFHFLPLLLYFHTEPQTYASVLREVYLSQTYFEDRPSYFSYLYNPKHFQTIGVSLYESILSFSAPESPHMIRSDCFEKLHNLMTESLRLHLKRKEDGIDEDETSFWLSNRKYALFYRILDTLYLSRHLYKVNYQVKQGGEQNQMEQETTVDSLSEEYWVSLKMPFLELDRRASPRKIASCIYNLYQRYHQNLKIQRRASHLDKQKASQSVDTGSFSGGEDSFDDDFVPVNGGDFTEKNLNNLLNNTDGNVLFRSTFVDNVVDEQSEYVIATKTLDLSRFKSLTTTGKKKFEDAIIKHEILHEPLPNDLTKEEMLCRHLYNEFIDTIAVHKTIGDCLTNPLFQLNIETDYSIPNLETLLNQSFSFDMKSVGINFDLDEPSEVAGISSSTDSSPSTSSSSSSSSSTNSSSGVTRPSKKRKNDNPDQFFPPKKRRKLKKPRTANYKEKMSIGVLKSHWIKSLQTNKFRLRIKIPNALTFEKFRDNTFHHLKNEKLTKCCSIGSEFLVSTLYELLLTNVMGLCQEDIHFILRGISKDQENGATKPKSQKKTRTTTTTSTNEILEKQHHLLIKKIKNEFTSVPEIGDDDDSFLLNQKAIVAKYSPLVEFNSDESKDFHRGFEVASPFDMDNPLIGKILRSFKEFLRISTYYTFSKKNLDEAVKEFPKGDPHHMDQVIQILDENNVEVIPTTDTKSCFTKSLKFGVNMDGVVRDKANAKKIAYIMPETVALSLGVEDVMDEVTEESDEEDDGGEREEPRNVQVVGKVLYDTESFYLSTTGILDNQLKLTSPKKTIKVSNWVQEYLAVDLYNIWKDLPIMQ